MKYTQVDYPKWADPEHTAIDCVVTFDHIEEPVPFTASQFDTEDHGKEIFARCAAGEFGVVSSYMPPTSEQLAEQIRAERNRLLFASDWTQLPDVPQATKDAWAAYRQALRDVPEQSTFPFTVAWPIYP